MQPTLQNPELLFFDNKLLMQTGVILFKTFLKQITVVSYSFDEQDMCKVLFMSVVHMVSHSDTEAANQTKIDQSIDK